jgi:hypothetical protein
MPRASNQYRLWLADLLDDQLQRLNRSTVSAERILCLRRMKILIDTIDAAILCAPTSKTRVESLRTNPEDLWISAAKRDDVSLRNG